MRCTAISCLGALPCDHAPDIGYSTASCFGTDSICTNDHYSQSSSRKFLVKQTPLNVSAKVPNQPLYRPSGSIAQGADGMAFDSP